MRFVVVVELSGPRATQRIPPEQRLAGSAVVRFNDEVVTQRSDVCVVGAQPLCQCALGCWQRRRFYENDVVMFWRHQRRVPDIRLLCR